MFPDVAIYIKIVNDCLYSVNAEQTTEQGQEELKPQRDIYYLLGTLETNKCKQDWYQQL